MITPITGGAADRSENGEWRAGGDPAGAGDDDDGNGRTWVARDHKRHTGRRQGEIDEVSGEPVCRCLNWRAMVARRVPRNSMI